MPPLSLDVHLCSSPPQVDMAERFERKRASTPLASKNGTYVNGERVTSAVSVHNKDEIRIGSVRLKFRILGVPPSTETTG